ncbi:MAG TPA: glycoside hydrolase family 38 C-terminal domain-containing protein [Kofleriaceae bacterium]|nr:glycoside hydrolase family 38 C-terminal domain-containing protein [Kofleriaceae bacterium]
MKKLHMIGNAHIDPVWLWRWQEGFQEVKATFRSALDRLREAPDLVFTASSACFYAWVEENDPAMFEEIRARVAEGRWCVTGGWWIEPDCNLPGGEAFVRQGLYGQRYLREKLGVTARVGYNPDAFGHAATLPQILRKSGIDRYCFLRPNHAERELPARLFAWEGPDGSRVTTFRIPYEYCAPGDDIEAHIRRCAGELDAAPGDLMCFYGVGNHGGGPTIANLAQIRRLDGADGLPALSFSTPDRYFDEAEARGGELPVVRGELQYHARGCFAVHSGVKRWNRQAEAALGVAERLGEVARQVADAPVREDLARAWKGVLFNQFHDILAGTSLEAAYDDARDLHGEAMAIAARATNHAVQALAWRIGIDPAPGGKPIAVFNPHAWASRVLVELDYGGLRDGQVLVDDEGRRVAFQVVRSGATVATWRKRLAFVAELPPLGWRVYRVVPGEAARGAEPSSDLEVSEGRMSNALVALALDAGSGGPRSLVDRRSGRELLAGPARAVVYDDPSDTWSHGVRRYDRALGAFDVVRVRVVERGPVRAALRVESVWGASTLVQEYSIAAGDPRVEVRATVDWREKRKVLKLRFPTCVAAETATFEAPYGFVERTAGGDEEPGHAWLDVSSGSAGLSLLNDSKYSFDVAGGDIGMTVLRSPIYAHHDPLVPEEDGVYRYIDQGPQDFTYALLPHGGSWRAAGTVRRAAELNARAIPLVETYHAGPLALRGSAVSVDHDAVMVSVLKRAEDGDDLVVRAVECHGGPAEARIRLEGWGRTIDARFGPCEIKTWRVPRDRAQPVRETDLIERLIE